MMNAPSLHAEDEILSLQLKKAQEQIINSNCRSPTMFAVRIKIPRLWRNLIVALMEKTCFAIPIRNTLLSPELRS